MSLGVVWVIPSGFLRAVIVRSFRLLRICNSFYKVGCSPSIQSAALLSVIICCSRVLWSRTSFDFMCCSAVCVSSVGAACCNLS